MTDHEERRRIRRFIGSWSRERASTPLPVLQAAALDRFAADLAFVRTFLPIAIGRDPAAVRELLRAPLAAAVLEELHVLQITRGARFRLAHGCWVRQPEETWGGPAERA